MYLNLQFYLYITLKKYESGEGPWFWADLNAQSGGRNITVPHKQNRQGCNFVHAVHNLYVLCSRSRTAFKYSFD